MGRSDLVQWIQVFLWNDKNILLWELRDIISCKCNIEINWNVIETCILKKDILREKKSDGQHNDYLWLEILSSWCDVWTQSEQKSLSFFRSLLKSKTSKWLVTDGCTYISLFLFFCSFYDDIWEPRRQIGSHKHPQPKKGKEKITILA